MIGYYDPDSLKVEEASGIISFINAADGTDIHEVSITTGKEARRVANALQDQIKHGVTGLNGGFRKIQGIFTRLSDCPTDGIITESDMRETPIRATFDTGPDGLPERGICIALGEMVEGALMTDRMKLAPLPPMPSPQHGMQIS